MELGFTQGLGASGLEELDVSVFGLRAQLCLCEGGLPA